jgi:tRNA threonylcarbamoyladenosine biosynthesis protein TsaB
MHLCGMAFILCIETSGPLCSVALVNDSSEVIEYMEDNTGFQHAAVLTVLIEQMFAKLSMTLSDINAIALSGGPGSYTGLRIGTSVAKGICFALEIPLLAISTLEVLASTLLESQTIHDKEYICAAIDARRMEVYAAVYDNDLNCIDAGKPVIIDETSYTEILDKGLVHFIGSGAEKIYMTISHNNLRYVKDEMLNARSMAKLASNRWSQKEFEDIAYFDPFYLKAFHTVAKKT